MQKVKTFVSDYVESVAAGQQLLPKATDRQRMGEVCSAKSPGILLGIEGITGTYFQSFLCHHVSYERMIRIMIFWF